ncbi:MAG: hypothetical protein F4X12_09205 [Acidobacteriia bacterium]|nr:hypothetical protein [Terriglobia bacterium]
MARRTESSINNDLAAALRQLHPAWNEQTLLAESTGVLAEGAGRRPDIVVTNESRVGGVILETELHPALNVEREAQERLGSTFAADGSAVEQAIAVRIPTEARSPGTRLEGLPYTYKACTRGAETVTWFPAAGWLEGTLADLAGFVETLSVSPRQLAEGVNALEAGVQQAANIIRRRPDNGGSIERNRIAEVLHQRDGEQTTRMAAAILANALVVHSAIAGVAPDVRRVANPSMRDAEGVLLQAEVLATWQQILDVNYWPIFSVARDILGALDEAVAGQALTALSRAASKLAGLGATTIGDLAGQMFGRLITDRKFLATFYTRPPSALLLAELAVARSRVDWSDPNAVGNLRVADLACGTGALLSATYRRMAARLRRAGLRDAELHHRFMESVLIGCDIMPAATHLTAAQLSSAHPTVTFGNTRIHTMPYGEADPGDGKGRRPFIGSLELLDDAMAPTLFGTGARTVTGVGAVEDSARGQVMDMPDGSLDLVIMNPPFTRPTNHEVAEVPVPSFAGFETSELEQQTMSRRLSSLRKRLAHDPAGHGNAGLATNFVDLAHTKVRPGGTVALVLPATVIAGASWAASRQLLRRHYRDLAVVTIAATGSSDRAFSADTGMADALILATRAYDVEPNPTAADVLWVNLGRAPQGFPEALEVAHAIRAIPADRPTGRLRVGDNVLGCYIRADLSQSGCASVRETDVADAALALERGQLRLAGLADFPIPVTDLSRLGRPGPYHLDIRSGGTTARGPFEIEPLAAGTTPSYPLLWSHRAARERRLFVAPDRQGRILPGLRQKALRVWGTSTRLHINSDFRLNSQSLAACLTPKPAIGGRAWPSFLLENRAYEQSVVLWSATTLGLIGHWWVGSRQQQGRSNLSVGRLGSIPMMDCVSLTDDQVGSLDAIFDRFADRDLLPANEAYRDLVRQELDEAVLCEALGLPDSILDPLATLRWQWCAEPSVHGGKATRPNGP